MLNTSAPPRQNNFKALGVLLIAVAALTIGGCDNSPERNSGPDKDRGGALNVGIGQVVNDDLNPDEGDTTDWKSFAVPAPGFLTVQVFWDQSKDIKNAVISVHDKFGAQLEARKHQAAIPQDEVVVRVEGGYYFVKLTAEKGASIYSLVGRHTIGSDSGDGGGFSGPRPEFAGIIEVGAGSGGAADAGGSGGGAAAGGGGGGGAAAGGGDGGGGGALPVAAGGGGALPVAAGGGGALPVAAAGGAAAAPAAPAPAAPVASDLKSVVSDKRASKPAAEKKPAKSASIKPIAADISGPYHELKTDLRLVTALDSGSKLKLGAGDAAGVKVGQIGEIYVGGKLLSGGRFKITKVLKRSSFAKTNAPVDAIKNADKIIIKIPEE